MFNKKSCGKCGKKLNGNYSFCPHCGNSFKKTDSGNWGMLGENDSMEEREIHSNSLFGGFSEKMLGKMLGSAMRMFEKEIQKEMTDSKSFPKTNFELIINGKRVDPKNIRVTRQPIQQNQTQVKKVNPKILPNFSGTDLKKISKLPKEEPKTNIRRLSDKVVYEIEVPGVKSIKDVSIIKLESSIEIKAHSKDKMYFKTISINLPITDYSFSEEKLVLELGVKN